MKRFTKMLLAAGLFCAGTTIANAQVKIPADIEALLTKNTCLACHRADQKLVGPGYKEVMAKKKYKPEQIVELIYAPKPANWPGYPPMAALPSVPKDEALKIAQWIVSLAPKKK
ncbi:c-type cytochrome [Runella slithyformis]|uniref:Cytochrome c class I n=1 Tax=Runella slithyformis (strain ATCC 29530 / DSM 19594 / LMG 11500 / NCIMB 11436 / LSU 4) TaxID=761193 RepID=A0A7U3ZJJ0_RUNSL|nr:c-type cytochrome [Runella slithyformis]AEI48295.1 cytochrome c class I [Runella slithyformis DSM 19594]